jgi:hypothetical protein
MQTARAPASVLRESVMGEGSAAEWQSSSSERAARVARRVEELRRRRAELAAGERPSAESVNFARQRAQDALHHAAEAHHASAQRHEELARVHERVANNYQRPAIRGADGPAEELQDKADRHWQAAHDSHLRFVEDEARAQSAENSSAGWPPRCAATGTSPGWGHGHTFGQ